MSINEKTEWSKTKEYNVLTMVQQNSSEIKLWLCASFDEQTNQNSATRPFLDQTLGEGLNADVQNVSISSYEPPVDDPLV